MESSDEIELRNRVTKSTVESNRGIARRNRATALNGGIELWNQPSKSSDGLESNDRADSGIERWNRAVELAVGIERRIRIERSGGRWDRATELAVESSGRIERWNRAVERMLKSRDGVNGAIGRRNGETE